MKNATNTVIALIALSAACSYVPSPVRMSGSRADLDLLTGEWSGTYETDGGGRGGSILFRLTAGQDSARGDVLMVVHPRNQPPSDLANARDPWTAELEQSRLLSISFVRIEGGDVYGVLDRYTDPVCGCTLNTTFTGTLMGDVIEGTFRSMHLEEGSVTMGTWTVTRQSPSRKHAGASP